MKLCLQCSFNYEALHFSGSCGAGPESASSSSNALFGPSMAAVRRRKSPVQSQSASLDPLDPSKFASPSSALNEQWQTPKKFARRNLSKASNGRLASHAPANSVAPPSQKLKAVPVSGEPAGRFPPSVSTMDGELPAEPVVVSMGPSLMQLQQIVASGPLSSPSVAFKPACRSLECVPVGQGGRAEEEAKAKSKSNSEILVSVPVAAVNLVTSEVFGSTPLVLGGLSKSCGGGLSGPSKRTRPVDPLVQ